MMEMNLKFLPLNGNKKQSSGVTDEMKQRFLDEYKNYLNQIKWQS